MVQFMVYYMVMIKINIHEAKANLSSYIRRLRKGETIILCNRNVPIAEIRPLQPERRARRPIGLAKGKLRISRGFNEPLPDDILDSFYGGGT